MSSNGAPGSFALSCALPLASTDRVLLGHGSGGKMTAELIARMGAVNQTRDEVTRRFVQDPHR